MIVWALTTELKHGGPQQAGKKAVTHSSHLETNTIAPKQGPFQLVPMIQDPSSFYSDIQKAYEEARIHTAQTFASNSRCLLAATVSVITKGRQGGVEKSITSVFFQSPSRQSLYTGMQALAPINDSTVYHVESLTSEGVEPRVRGAVASLFDWLEKNSPNKDSKSLMSQ